jgi:hypothetical protein
MSKLPPLVYQLPSAGAGCVAKSPSRVHARVFAMELQDSRPKAGLPCRRSTACPELYVKAGCGDGAVEPIECRKDRIGVSGHNCAREVFNRTGCFHFRTLVIGRSMIDNNPSLYRQAYQGILPGFREMFGLINIHVDDQTPMGSS